ncbi:flagellar biosynthesis protein FliA [bacterium]|nr:flagellar biosynthesis protein FliA [bacterium]
MTAKQYLRQAYRLNELINSDLKELEQLKELATSVSSPNLSGMPSSGSRKDEAPFVRAIEKIIDLEKYINTEIDRFVDLKREIRTVIFQVQDNNQKLCLKLRYMQFLKWESVAEEMKLSLKQVHRIHGDALQAVQKILPYDTK